MWHRCCGSAASWSQCAGANSAIERHARRVVGAKESAVDTRSRKLGIEDVGGLCGGNPSPSSMLYEVV